MKKETQPKSMVGKWQLPVFELRPLLGLSRLGPKSGQPSMAVPTKGEKVVLKETNGSYIIPKWFVALNVAVMTMLAPAVPTGSTWAWKVSTTQSVNSRRLEDIEKLVGTNNKLITSTRESQIRLDGVRTDLRDLSVRLREIESRQILPGAQHQIDQLRERLSRIESRIEALKK